LLKATALAAVRMGTRHIFCEKLFRGEINDASRSGIACSNRHSATLAICRVAHGCSLMRLTENGRLLSSLRFSLKSAISLILTIHQSGQYKWLGERPKSTQSSQSAALLGMSAIKRKVVVDMM
jgi:hypothetical protein